MTAKKVNIVFNILLISLFALCLISAVSASGGTNSTVSANGTHYIVSSNLSNDAIQSMIDNASVNDTFEFTSSNYNNITLVIEKQLKFVSNNSTVNVAILPSKKASALGICNTFGFYFTGNSSGSTLSGFNIMAPSADNAVILDGSSNTIIENNTISGAQNNVLVRLANNVQIINNYIHNATLNSIQVQNVSNIKLFNNTIAFNGRSGIETSNMFNSNISWNEIFFNSFNGISLYNRSSNNHIEYNHVYENTNGIYINSYSTNDKIYYNTLEFNRMDPDSELGGFETGNGLLFGEFFESSRNKLPDISYNALIHNENFQAKNNPSKDPFKLGTNYFDSNDGEHTFICPMLLAKILTMNFSSVSNGIGIKIFEDDQPVKGFAMFNQKVTVDGKEYSVTIKDGEGVVEVDSSSDHVVEVTHGEKIPDHRKVEVSKYEPSSDNGGTSSGGSGNEQGSGSGNGGVSGSGSGSGTSDSTTDSNDGDEGTVSNNKNGDDMSNNMNNSTSVSSNNQGNVVANYGTNSSNVPSQSESVVGEQEQSQGQENAAESGSVESGDSSSPGDSQKNGKAYEVSSVTKKSNPLNNNSPLIVAAVIFLVVVFIYGYRRKDGFE